MAQPNSHYTTSVHVCGGFFIFLFFGLGAAKINPVSCARKRRLLSLPLIQHILCPGIDAAAPLVALKPQLTATNRQHLISPLSHNFIHLN